MIHVRVEGAGPCWLFDVATLPRPRAPGRSQPKCRAAAVHEAELKYRKESNCRSPIEPSGNAAISTSVRRPGVHRPARRAFQGLPKPDPRYPADAADRWWTYTELAVPLETVQANFARYGLLDGQVRFFLSHDSIRLDDGSGAGLPAGLGDCMQGGGGAGVAQHDLRRSAGRPDLKPSAQMVKIPATDD